jgi:hypothetical protein
MLQKGCQQLSLTQVAAATGAAITACRRHQRLVLQGLPVHAVVQLRLVMASQACWEAKPWLRVTSMLLELTNNISGWCFIGPPIDGVLQCLRAGGGLTGHLPAAPLQARNAKASSYGVARK